MNRNADRRLNRRLWRAFVLQLVLISATAAGGVYLAEFAIREILIVSALEEEANYFWSRNRIERHTPAPNTYNLIGYLYNGDPAVTLPEEFQGLDVGIHNVRTAVGESVVHVSYADGEWLYLVFDANNVKQLAAYFGVVPLTLMLTVLYGAAWFAYRISRRAVSPVTALARKVRDLDLEATDTLSFDPAQQIKGADDEVLVLSQALQQLVHRINRFVDRERNFTREASHELRSPLTVIRMAGDVLLARPDLDAASRTAVERIRRAAHDMEELTRAFLLLAREHEDEVGRELISVNDVARAEIERCKLIYADKDIAVRLTEDGELQTESSPRVLSIVLGNLIRNAFAYTDRGTIDVHIGDRDVSVEDSGIGMDEHQIKAARRTGSRMLRARRTGHGIGLSLVRRLTARCGWVVEFDSEPGRGTRVHVRFPQARFSAAGEPPDGTAGPPARQRASRPFTKS